MRRRVFLSGDWLATGQAGAGLLSRRTLCGRRGRGCRCQLVQVSRPEASYWTLPLPAPQEAGEGSRGPRRARPLAAGIAASILLRASGGRGGLDAGRRIGDPGRAPGHLVSGWGLAPRRTPAQPLCLSLSVLGTEVPLWRVAGDPSRGLPVSLSPPLRSLSTLSSPEMGLWEGVFGWDGTWHAWTCWELGGGGRGRPGGEGGKWTVKTGLAASFQALKVDLRLVSHGASLTALMDTSRGVRIGRVTRDIPERQGFVV